MLRRIKSLVQSKAAESAAHRMDGDGHLQAERMDDAAAAYRRAVEADPRNVEAWVGLGYVLKEGAQSGAARDALNMALSVDPANADAHYMLGAMAKEEGDVAAAMSAFGRAIECRPDFEFAYREQFALLAQTGQSARAAEVLDRAAAACPGAADVHYMRGKMRVAQNDYAAAVESFRKASSLAPGAVEYHKGLGDALRQAGDPTQAAASYRKAVALDPGFFDGHLAIADELQRQGKHDEAAGHYRKALALRPDSAAAHVNLGVTQQAQGKIDDAIASYSRAAQIDPRLTVANANLGSLLMTRGANDEAIACFERVVEVDPGHPASYLLAGLKGGVSDRAPGAYVEKLFDWYSERFESHLVKELRYNVPADLRDLLQPYATGQGGKWDVLDLGCGTGLVGASLAPMARSLVGVDLSSRMLDKARERNLYDRLEQLDVVTMMQAEAPSSYDLVVAADVFVYVGKLDELVMQAHRVLRAGGYFAFSVESLDALASQGARGEDFRLIDTGRFAHSAGYLARLCGQGGFKSLHTSGTQIRTHHGKGIEGYLVLWQQRSADPAAANAQSPNGNLKGMV